MRPISLLSIMALCLATGSAGIVTSEQKPMSEDVPVRTATSWEYVDCGLWFDFLLKFPLMRVTISRSGWTPCSDFIHSSEARPPSTWTRLDRYGERHCHGDTAGSFHWRYMFPEITNVNQEGAYADVTVKLGLIKLLQKQFDICEEAYVVLNSPLYG